ncbi:uncharacterized protein [Dermacentor andersoni]|uniref:uncharacterized protein n=1 Tax=Dermacentor andersoni TaxID=34620 RepID=UPI00241601D0|nr:kinesin-like protein KIF26B [Dermacentor andersoni]
MAHSLTPIPPPRPDYPWRPPVYDESALCPWGAAPNGPPPVKRPCYASIRRGPTRLPEVYASVLPPAFWEDGHQRAVASQLRDAWCKACQARLWKLKKTCLGLMTQIREEIVQGRLSTGDETVSSLVASRLARLDYHSPLVEGCCDLCHSHGNQLRREALDMVQSLEHWCPATGIPLHQRPASPPRVMRRLAENCSPAGRRAPTPW